MRKGYRGKPPIGRTRNGIKTVRVSGMSHNSRNDRYGNMRLNGAVMKRMWK